jgi:hypothetical protein
MKKKIFDACCGKAKLLTLKKIHADRKQGNEDLKYVVNINNKFNIFVHELICEIRGSHGSEP